MTGERTKSDAYLERLADHIVDEIFPLEPNIREQFLSERKYNINSADDAALLKYIKEDLEYRIRRSKGPLVRNFDFLEM